jgi:hypothetical protein
MKTELATEIRAVVARLKLVQDGPPKLSDNQLLRQFPDLGSTRTWRQRLAADQLDDLNLERTAEKLRRVAVILDGGLPDEIFYSKMSFAREFDARLQRLEHATNDRRILLCHTPTGVGKSVNARFAVAQKRATRAYVRMRPSWRNKIVHICKGFGRALGFEITSSNVADAESSVITSLCGQPKTIFIDQAHEGGVALMHMLRCFVDETPSRFVWLGYATAYNRVRTADTDALIEAQAFMGRCLKPIFDLYKEGISNEDAAFYLEANGGLTGPQARALAVKVAPRLREHTNLRLLDDAIYSAGKLSENGHLDPETIADEVSRLAGVARENEPEESE